MLPQNLEKRLVRLEENAYFLEEQIKGVDRQTAAQQEQLDQLDKNLKQVLSQLREIHELLSESRASADNLPPHHLPRFW